jgi:hypothetical protein
MQGEALERLIVSAVAEANESLHLPVFVTDELETSLFLKHRVPVEPVPRSSAWSESVGADAYIAQTLRRIRARWQPLAVLSIGREPAAHWLTVLRGE